MSESTITKIQDKYRTWRESPVGLEWRRRLGLRTKGNKARLGLPPWNKGMKMSGEFREKCRAAQVGKRTGQNNPFFGRKHSPETLAKMAAARARRKDRGNG